MEAAWYIPAHIHLWRESAGVGVDPITELIALNHPEAVAEEEAIDCGVFGELLSQQGISDSHCADIMAAICSQSTVEIDAAEGESDDLIDKFLELKDLRIIVNSEADFTQTMSWEQIPLSDTHNFEDDASSEELAAIYLSQGLFEQAKEIYTRLFLLYSEKSVYFAGLIEKIDKENN